jgi:hypothetical protein
VFVEVVESDPAGEGYVHDGRVYEVSDTGIPEAVVAVPRPIDGSTVIRNSNGVTWGCGPLGLARFEPAEQVSFMIRGTDRVAGLAWFRTFSAPTRDDYYMSLSNGRSAFSAHGGRAVVVAVDGYLADPVDLTVEVPLRGWTLGSGRAVDGVLEITLAAPPSVPDTNAGRSFDRDGKLRRVWCHAFNAVCVTGVELDDARLRVGIGWPDRVQWVSFPLAGWLPAE